jgi:hypothetical protein
MATEPSRRAWLLYAACRERASIPGCRAVGKEELGCTKKEKGTRRVGRGRPAQEGEAWGVREKPSWAPRGRKFGGPAQEKSVEKRKKGGKEGRPQLGRRGAGPEWGGGRARWAARGRKMGKGEFWGKLSIFLFSPNPHTKNYFLAKTLNHKQENMVRHDATAIKITPRVYLHEIFELTLVRILKMYKA